MYSLSVSCFYALMIIRAFFLPLIPKKPVKNNEVVMPLLSKHHILKHIHIERFLHLS